MNYNTISSERNISNKNPIFILSCPRSGSTLLRYILDSHPEICCPPEIYLGSLIKKLYKSIYFSIGQIEHGSTSTEKNKFVAQEVQAIILNIMERYSHEKRKLLWCEKTPNNVYFLDEISNVFPDAKYICLYRHCVDVVYSLIQAKPYKNRPDMMPYLYQNTGNMAGAGFDSWLEQTSIISNFEREHKEMCFSVNYEELVNNPNNTLSALFQFIGVDWDELFLERAFIEPHDQGEGDSNVAFEKKIHTNSIGKGFLMPLEGIKKTTLSKVDSLLDSLHYPSVEVFITEGLDEEIKRITILHKKSLSNIKSIFEHHFNNVLITNKDIKYKTYSDIGRCKFVIRDTGDVWIVDIANAEAKIINANDKADCAILISSDLLVAILDGRVNPIVAYENDSVNVIGNIDVAIQVISFLLKNQNSPDLANS